MNRYLSLFHTPAWTKARIGADAPMNDLQFIHKIMDYKEIDKEVAGYSFKLTNHQLYLTEEIVPFAFFSKHLSSCEKRYGSQTLGNSSTQKFCLGKPVFCQIPHQTGLSNLLRPESHTLFSILGINTDYLLNQLNSRQRNQDTK